MFYRPGGASQRINVQYDEVYADTIGGATGFLPVNKGDWIAINVSRASINFVNSASSIVSKTPTAPEVQLLLEMKTIGGQSNEEAWPIDQWQNAVVATGLRAHRAGFIRLRILNINNLDGTGIAMALQVSRTGDSGAAS
jgi:hypothetical protein